MKKSIEMHIIPAFNAEYGVSTNKIFPIKVFSSEEVGEELKKTPNVFPHPDDDLDLAFSFPKYLKSSNETSLDQIKTGASLLQSVSYRSSLEYQFKLMIDPEAKEFEMPDLDVYTDQPIYPTND